MKINPIQLARTYTNTNKIPSPLPYPELQAFKQKHLPDSRLSELHHLYQEKKEKQKSYKAIFAGFSAIFLGLAAFMSSKSIHAAVHLAFGISFPIKGAIISLTIFMAIAALYITWKMTAEEDALQEIARRAHQSLWREHEERRLKKGLHGFLLFGEKLHLRYVLKLLYREVYDQFEKHLREARNLFESVSKKRHMDAVQKEMLKVQILADCQGKLKRSVEIFNTKQLVE